MQLRATSFIDSFGPLMTLDSLAVIVENKAEEHAHPLLTLARAQRTGSVGYNNDNWVRTIGALVDVAKSL